jgi:hypothetical protein
MAIFEVTWTATAHVEVEAADEKAARRLSRQQLDPDVDWDFENIEEIGE